MPRHRPPRVQSLPSAAPVDAQERLRDDLTEAEFRVLLQGPRPSRYHWRNAAMLLLTFSHGLRMSELCNLRRHDVDLHHGRIWMARLRGSLSTEQPLLTEERRSLKRSLQLRSDAQRPWRFPTERGDQFTRLSSNDLVGITGERAGLAFHVHPHMLRHGCCYALANRGDDLRLIQDDLGHRDPKHTTRYTCTAAHRFAGWWE